MAVAAFMFSLMSLFVKLAGRRIPTMEIVLVRASINVVISVALIARAGLSPLGNRRGLLLLRGLLGSLALIGFFGAVVHLPLAEATMVHYTNPALTALLAAWLLGERVEGRVVGCVAASLAGVALIARPASIFGGAAAGIDPRWVGVGLVAAALSASAYVTVRKLRASDHALVIVLYFPMVTVPIALPFALADWVWPTPAEWLALAGIGVTTQIAQIALTMGLAREAAGRATAVGYLQVAFAALWGALFFGETPDAWSLAGAGLIFASLVALARPRRAESPSPTLA